MTEHSSQSGSLVKILRQETCEALGIAIEQYESMDVGELEEEMVRCGIMDPDKWISRADGDTYWGKSAEGKCGQQDYT